MWASINQLNLIKYWIQGIACQITVKFSVDKWQKVATHFDKIENLKNNNLFISEENNF
jgi:hypothetical protein